MTRSGGTRRIVGIGAALTLVGGCSTNTGAQVDIPWTTSSPPAGGVAAVTVSAAQGGDEPLQISVEGGDAWRALAWTSATAATIAAGVDPRGGEFLVDVTAPAAAGPSSGGALAAAVWATIDGVGIRPGATVVGRILPNGALAPASDISSLLREAAAHGITEVWVAPGTRRVPTHGLSVRRAATLQEAYERLRDGSVPPRETAVPQIDPGLTELVTIATRQIVEQVRVQAAGLPTSPQARRTGAALTRAAASARRLLRAGEPWRAYAHITAAQQEYLMRAAAWSVPRSPAEARRTVTRGLRATTARVGRVLAVQAATPLSYVEQFTALADALTWATGTLAILDQAGARLADARSTAQLRGVARDTARASYRIETYLPLQVEAVSQIGKARATAPDELLQFLDGYALLLAGAADAAMADLTTTDEWVPDLRARVDAQQRVWQQTAPPDGTQPVTMTRLAAALSYYIASANAGSAPESRFDSQLRIATAQNERAAAEVAGRGFDASCVLWGDEWGRTWARSDGGTAADARQRGTGITYQWYATVQGAMLRAVEQ